MPVPAIPRLTRRRFVHISAAAAGLAFLPIARRSSAAAAFADPGSELRVWRGVALGADATLQIHHSDASAADRLIDVCLAEVARLERVFSLYRETSAICRLNRDGMLDDPPVELVALLGQSEQFSQLTGGMFDPTVQPLWDLYAAHFSQADADPAGPAGSSIAAALRRVDHAAIAIDASRIAFAKPAMAITLNGIAQGYITDRVVELLRAEGVDRSLVDMGEIRAIGPRPTGEPWTVGLEDPTSPGRTAQRISIENKAVSTSGGYGTPLDPAGRFNHLFDPTTGGTSWRYLSVSVVASTATTADALSTALSLMPLAETNRVVQELGVTAHFVLPDGSRLVQNA